MRYSFLDSIRVDQSHCNYYLVDWFALRGWHVLFIDPGRASRGGTGSQGSILRIFEESGLPIPDIVTMDGDSLLLVEIDSAFSKAQRSLNTYQAKATLILNKINSQLSNNHPARHLLTGFCRMGLTRDITKYFRVSRELAPSIDFWAAFSQPRIPICEWARPYGVEK